MRTKKLSTKAQLLQGVSLFSACTHDELELAAALVDQVDLPAGATLTKEGDSGWEAFVIVSGKAVADLGGQRIATLGPGEAVGEMALLDRAPRSATVTAETDLQALVVTQQALDRLIDETHVARNLLKALARRLREADAIASW